MPVPNAYDENGPVFGYLINDQMRFERMDSHWRVNFNSLARNTWIFGKQTQ